MKRSSRPTRWGRVSGSTTTYLIGTAKVETRWGFHVGGTLALAQAINEHATSPYQANRGGFLTEKLALKALDAHLDKLANDYAVISLDMTVGELYEDWQRWLPPQTAVSYAVPMKNHILPWFRDEKIGQLPFLISRHYLYLAKRGKHVHTPKTRCKDRTKCKDGAPMKANTLLGVDTALRSMYTHATKDLRLFVFDPMGQIRKPASQEYREVTTWDEQTREMALAVAALGPDTIIVAIVLLTGMRAGECAGLRWDSIDWDARTFEVNNQITTRPGDRRVEKGPKAASDRTLFLVDELYDLLKCHQEQQRLLGEAAGWTSDYVLCNLKTGHPLNSQEVSESWKKALRDHDLPEDPTHVGRHVYATWLRDLGLPTGQIGQALGHKPGSKATAVYIQKTNAGAQQAAILLNEALKKGKTDEEGPERQVA